jgi:hypothetical protein
MQIQRILNISLYLVCKGTTQLRDDWLFFDQRRREKGVWTEFGEFG